MTWGPELGPIPSQQNLAHWRPAPGEIAAGCPTSLHEVEPEAAQQAGLPSKEKPIPFVARTPTQGLRSVEPPTWRTPTGTILGDSGEDECLSAEAIPTPLRLLSGGALAPTLPTNAQITLDSHQPRSARGGLNWSPSFILHVPSLADRSSGPPPGHFCGSRTPGTGSPDVNLGPSIAPRPPPHAMGPHGEPVFRARLQPQGHKCGQAAPMSLQSRLGPRNPTLPPSQQSATQGWISDTQSQLLGS